MYKITFKDKWGRERYVITNKRIEFKGWETILCEHQKECFTFRASHIIRLEII